MFQYDSVMAEAVFDYCRDRLALDPVPLDVPVSRADIEATIANLVGPGGHDAVEVLTTFCTQVATSVISCDSPRYLSFVPAAPTKASLLFDMVVSASSLQGISWLEAAGAIAAENQALRWLADLAGLPETAGGCFVSGGFAANLSALVVARDVGRSRHGRDQVRMAMSEEAHSSVDRALHIIGVEPLLVPSTDHRFTGDALRAALAADPHPSDVVGVIATAGTTNAGLVDDLAGVSAVARDRELWLHVDGAYGGAALLSPMVRGLYQGIEHADSFVVDPHKWLFAPFDCAAVIYRRPQLAKAVHTQHASDLDAIHTQQAEEWNPSDYAYHLTRRARGLALWYSLAVYGGDNYRRAVEAALALARRAGELIVAAPYLALVREPELSVVLFRRLGWEAPDYQRWSQKLLRDQVAFVMPTTWEGQTVARLAFLNPETTDDIVREILATMA